VARYDALRRELGILPPLPSYCDSGPLIAQIQASAGKPSGLAKALGGFQRRATASVRQTKALLQRHVQDPKVANRAKLADIQKRTDAAIQRGELSAAEGALLDVHMGNFARQHCQ
jgi:hypothetical protein